MKCSYSTYCIFIKYCTWKCWLVQVTQWYLYTCTWIVLPPGACTVMLLRAAVPGRTATDIICGCDCWHMTIVGTDCGTNCTIIGLVVDVLRWLLTLRLDKHGYSALDYVQFEEVFFWFLLEERNSSNVAFNVCNCNSIFLCLDINLISSRFVFLNCSSNRK